MERVRVPVSPRKALAASGAVPKFQT